MFISSGQYIVINSVAGVRERTIPTERLPLVMSLKGTTPLTQNLPLHRKSFSYWWMLSSPVFSPEEGGRIYLRNDGIYWWDYVLSHPKSLQFEHFSSNITGTRLLKILSCNKVCHFSKIFPTKFSRVFLPSHVLVTHAFCHNLSHSCNTLSVNKPRSTKLPFLLISSAMVLFLKIIDSVS
jgi:hypothetical protein